MSGLGLYAANCLWTGLNCSHMGSSGNDFFAQLPQNAARNALRHRCTTSVIIPSQADSTMSRVYHRNSAAVAFAGSGNPQVVGNALTHLHIFEPLKKERLNGHSGK